MTLSVERPQSYYSVDAPAVPSRNELVMWVLDNLDPSNRDDVKWRLITNAANIEHTLAALKSVRRDNVLSMKKRESSMEDVLAKCLTRGDYGQLEWDEARSAFGRWYARAADLDTRLSAAADMLMELRNSHKTAELRELLEEYRGKVQMMSAAIRQHREAFSDDHDRPCSPSEYDEELWSLLRIDLV
jgi:hypothetical protein